MRPTPPNCIERLYLSLNAIGVCADIWLRIDVAGSLDVDLLRRAYVQLAGWESRLVSCVVRRPLDYHWRPVADPEAAIARAVFAQPDTQAAEATCQCPLDLARDLPVRLVVTPLPDGGQRLWFTCHHAFTDGRGALVLLRLLGAAMAGAQPGPQDRASFRLRTCYSQRPLLEWPGYAWRSLCAPLRTVRGTAPEVATWADHAPTPGVAHSGRQVLSLPDTILDVRRSARSRGLSPTSVLVAAAVRACHETWGSERDLPARVYVPVAIMAPEPTTLQNHVVSVSADLPSEDLAHMRLVEDHMEATLSEDTLSATALTTMTRFVVPSLLPPLLRELLARTHLRSTTNRRESLVVTWMRVAGDTLPSFPDATVADVNAWAHTHTPPGLRMMLVSGPRHNLCLTYSGTTIDPDSAGEALERTARHLLAS